MYKSWIIKASLLSLFVIALIVPLFNDYSDALKTGDDKDGVSVIKKVKEIPLHNVNLPEFSQIRDVKEKKKQFFAFLTPAIINENKRISQLRQQVLVIQEKLSSQQALSSQESQLVQALTTKYRVKHELKPIDKVAELVRRVDVVPQALVLVQAANESAWGTSRFARIGLNFFGIWCFKKGCGMVPNGRDEGLKHEVAAFQSVENAVQHYLFNINTNSAYHVFRTIREQLRQQNKPLSPQILATGLLPYSERGTDYVLEISDMIRHNQHYFTDYSE
ncbi:glucosaminidase domain-containing protein [Thalassotalea sp. G2M2-11]|uniref:glucosaminidase domain-containing protein n=1 Tax=Thalassotalea sp. G2M2-11 TaxID=2787627 RepID=UPI0019CF6741|nr:glucosaminidase domain-containing protein [Thalassotalea sp. G2M2-11]